MENKVKNMIIYYWNERDRKKSPINFKECYEDERGIIIEIMADREWRIIFWDPSFYEKNIWEYKLLLLGSLYLKDLQNENISWNQLWIIDKNYKRYFN